MDNRKLLIVAGILLLLIILLTKDKKENYYRFYRPYYEWDYGCATGNMHGTMSDGTEGVCVRGGYLMPSFSLDLMNPHRGGSYESVTY